MNVLFSGSFKSKCMGIRYATSVMKDLLQQEFCQHW